MKTIDGYNGRYTISENGEVYSNGKLLKQEINKHSHTNYRRVTLCCDGKTKRYLVHRLVGEYYVDNIDNKPCINHIDNNGENNHYSNLEWVTHSENMKHSARQNRQLHTTLNKEHRNNMTNARNNQYDTIAKNRIGTKFTDWEIVSICERESGQRENKFRLKAVCKCKCGKIQEIVFSRLLSGEAKRCKSCSSKYAWDNRKITTQQQV